MYERKKWRKYQSDIDDAREDDQLERDRHISAFKHKYGVDEFVLKAIPNGKVIKRENHAAVRYEYYKAMEELPDNEQSYRDLLSRFSKNASEERKAALARVVARLALGGVKGK